MYSEITSNLVSWRQTMLGFKSSVSVRTLSRLAYALSPRTFHDKIVVLAIGKGRLGRRGGGPQTMVAVGRRATRVPLPLFTVNSSSNASASLLDRSVKSLSKERLDDEEGAAFAGSTPSLRIRRISPLLEAGTWSSC